MGKWHLLDTTTQLIGRFDVKAERWVKLPSLPAGRHRFSAVVIGNNLYFTAGALGAVVFRKVRRVAGLTLTVNELDRAVYLP